LKKGALLAELIARARTRAQQKSCPNRHKSAAYSKTKRGGCILLYVSTLGIVLSSPNYAHSVAQKNHENKSAKQAVSK
jgi:hypothetical protein